MVSVGLIHLSCYCGADLFYVGNTADGAPPIEVMERLESKLGEGNFGFFSSANGSYGECPHCGLLFELPEPELLDWLPFTDRVTFGTTIEEIRLSSYSRNASPTQRVYPTSDRVTF
jgi:hypothetical protein